MSSNKSKYVRKYIYLKEMKTWSIIFFRRQINLMNYRLHFIHMCNVIKTNDSKFCIFTASTSLAVRIEVMHKFEFPLPKLHAKFTYDSLLILTK